MTAVGRFSTRPLYLQAKDMLVQRIVAGTWKPGAAIPNEIELSRELGISVGTVRKALDEMASERLDAYWPSPSAVAIARNTNVLSTWPRKAAAPGPDAVRITSSAACTPS